MNAARPTSRGAFVRHREPMTGRGVLSARTSAGTEVWVAPMPGFRKAYALLTTRYGSRDTQLPDGTRLPDGIAHFLEHKMFQTPEGDVFDVYAARGASANAYTTFSHTTYLFSCTSRFEENLDTLLTSMAELHTDSASVEREKGIIGQEIAMYEDDPSWRGYFQLLQSLYRRHPVRIDIAGTARTIAPIDPAILRRTHAAYYHPGNLVLVVAGDVDPRDVLSRAEALLPPRPGGKRGRRRPVAEPRAVRKATARLPLSVSRPHVLLGLKDRPPGPGRALVLSEVLSTLALDLLFGDGGRIQAPLYDEGVVDDTFGASYEAEADFAHAILAAEVDDAVAYRRRLERELRAASRSPAGAAEVERSRRRILGRHVRTFNAPERLAHWILGAVLEGVPLSAGVSAVRGATASAVTRRARALLAAPRAWSVLIPRAARA